MENSNLSSQIPPVETLEERFLFIEDLVLRRHVALTFQYVVFLIAVIDQEEIEDTTVGSTMHKSMIIHTGSIIEGCLHYCLQIYLETGKITESGVLGVGKKLTKQKELHKISDTQILCSAFEITEPKKYSSDIQFQNLMRACKKARILTDSTLKKADDIRKERNKIHLAGLGEIEMVYKKLDAQKVFEDASAILTRIETVLSR